MARKTVLKVRYPDDPEKVWITLEREKPPLSEEQRQHRQIMCAIRAAALVLIVFFLCMLASCEATGIIKAIGNM